MMSRAKTDPGGKVVRKIGPGMKRREKTPSGKLRNRSFQKSRHCAVKLNVTSQHSRVDEPQVAFDPKFLTAFC